MAATVRRLQQASHSLLMRILLGGVLVAMGTLLAGCDTFYDITVENLTSQEITVRLGFREWRMGACSVRTMRSVSGPPVSEEAEFEIEDTAGNKIQTIHVKPQRRSRVDTPQLGLQVAPQGGSACPAPVEGKYMLVVTNGMYSNVQIWRAKQLLGTVSPGAQEEFGPLPGAWQDADMIIVRDSRGRQNRASRWGPVAQYDLGQVQRVFLWISHDWPT